DFMFLADVNSDQVVNNGDIQAELHLLITGTAGGSLPEGASVPAVDGGADPIANSVSSASNELTPPLINSLAAQPAELIDPVAHESDLSSAVTTIQIVTAVDSSPVDSPKESATLKSIVFVSHPPQTSDPATYADDPAMLASVENAQVNSGTH